VTGNELELAERLRAGDEQAFAELVDHYHSRLVGLARQFVANHEAAEDVAQETWLAAVRSIDQFEGRSSLRTWLFQICVNRARSHGTREHRLVASGAGEPAVGGSRFGSDGGWITPPQHWAERIDDQLEAAALVDHARKAIERLPRSQQSVITLRDVEHLSPDEVCAVLSITDAQQRVLLHRGRSSVRRALEEVLGQ
jgi:RNA polymerase sigma-70 factor (ECF subfamily)